MLDVGGLWGHAILQIDVYLQPAARIHAKRPRVASPSTALGQTALDAANAHAANRALRR